MEFIAIDFETANADMASICQIGLAHYRNGSVFDEWKTYVNPKDYFDPLNVSIHGIDEETVKDAPTFKKVSHKIYEYLDNRIVVCHTHFDRLAVHRACSKYKLRTPVCSWLDSARVTRRTWDEFAHRGYGLANVCSSIGYEYAAHDALEDAKACAHVLISAIEKTGIGLHGWLKRVEQPIGHYTWKGKLELDGNPAGIFFGETLVFTGALKMFRREAADLASKAGFRVEDGVNKNTTILIVGDQDIRKLHGHEKSSKHRKAEDLIRNGQNLRILQESDFEELIKTISNTEL